MSIFIHNEKAFDKIKYSWFKTFSIMGINGYFLKMKKNFFFFLAEKQDLAYREILETLIYSAM